MINNIPQKTMLIKKTITQANLTSYGLVTPFVIIKLCQHWQHQAITLIVLINHQWGFDIYKWASK